MQFFIIGVTCGAGYAHNLCTPDTTSITVIHGCMPLVIYIPMTSDMSGSPVNNTPGGSSWK